LTPNIRKPAKGPAAMKSASNIRKIPRKDYQLCKLGVKH